MKGKVAFVVGAGVGYVLGTRAGRERYAQIKRGAQAVWETAPVQRGVSCVRSAAKTQVNRAKAAATQAGKNAFAALVQNNGAVTTPGEPATAPGSEDAK